MVLEEFQTFGWITNPSPLLEKGHPSSHLDIYFSLEMSCMEFSVGGGGYEHKGNFLVKMTVSCLTLPMPPHQQSYTDINLYFICSTYTNIYHVFSLPTPMTRSYLS